MSKRISKKRFDKIALRDNFKCVYCGGDYEHLDHVIPKVKGGTNEVCNLVMSCARCNARKHDLSITEFYKKNLSEFSKPDKLKKIFCITIIDKELYLI